MADMEDAAPLDKSVTPDKIINKVLTIISGDNLAKGLNDYTDAAQKYENIRDREAFEQDTRRTYDMLSSLRPVEPVPEGSQGILQPSQPELKTTGSNDISQALYDWESRYRQKCLKRSNQSELDQAQEEENMSDAVRTVK